VEVGIAVAKLAADNIVPVVMELGGKSPNIVFADADLDLAAQGVATAIFQNAGQTCSAGSRLLVERSAHGALVERLAARAKSMRVGPGVSDPDMGPIISSRQLETIERYVQIGTSEGARWPPAARDPRMQRSDAASISADVA
jgi:acyl-CoA reductase-like NAD-dependent aldehyde dehydrogenase